MELLSPDDPQQVELLPGVGSLGGEEGQQLEVLAWCEQQFAGQVQQSDLGVQHGFAVVTAHRDLVRSHNVRNSVLPWPEIPIPQDYFERQDDKARRILEDARNAVADNTADHGPPFVYSVVLPGPTVSTLANESKIADMMVVGCRGEGAFSRVQLGSVSTGLVNHAHCPVAVVHDEAPPPAQASVLMGIDGSPASELATEIAFDEAFRRGVDLVALHAWSDVSMSEVPGLDFATMEVQIQEALAEWLARWQERYPDVTVRRVVVRD